MGDWRKIGYLILAECSIFIPFENVKKPKVNHCVLYLTFKPKVAVRLAFWSGS